MLQRLGADGRTRTADLLFTKQLLCLLSYIGMNIGQGIPGPTPSTVYPTTRTGVHLPRQVIATNRVIVFP